MRICEIFRSYFWQPVNNNRKKYNKQIWRNKSMKYKGYPEQVMQKQRNAKTKCHIFYLPTTRVSVTVIIWELQVLIATSWCNAQNPLVHLDSLLLQSLSLWCSYTYSHSLHLTSTHDHPKTSCCSCFFFFLSRQPWCYELRCLTPEIPDAEFCAVVPQAENTRFQLSTSSHVTH